MCSTPPSLSRVVPPDFPRPYIMVQPFYKYVYMGICFISNVINHIWCVLWEEQLQISK